MTLTRHDDAVRARIRRDPEFARLRYETAVELRDGDDEDRCIALRILRDQRGFADDAVREPERKGVTG